MCLIRNRHRLFEVSRRTFHIQTACGNGSRLSLRRGFLSPELKLFMQMLKSPSHLMFVASNVALLVHLQFYSTIRRKQKMKEFLSQMDELENYVNLINDLDSQNEEIQKEIAILKQLQEKKSDVTDLAKDSLSGKQSSSRIIKTSSSVREQTSNHFHVNYADGYLKQRNFIASAFKDRENIAKLFKVCDHSEDKESENLLPSEDQTFSAPILNSLMALSHQFVKTFLVELNLNHALGDEVNREMIPCDSFLLHQDLFAFMKHDSEKEEMLAKLFAFKDNRKVKGSVPLWEELDESTVSELSAKFARTEDFKCKYNRRYDLYQFLSGRWLNYDHSDTFHSIQSLPSPKFGSSVINNDEYIIKFDKIFSVYELSKTPHPEYTLLLDLAKTLAAGGECVPGFSIFKVLLDKFGRIGLYNYQSMVYDVLPAFEFNDSAYADSSRVDEFAQRSAIHFEHLIEEHPDFLASLIEYQVPRKNVETFELLLDYFEPVVPSDIHSLKMLPDFVRTQRSKSSNLLKTEKVVLVNLDTIGRTFKSCVEMKYYDALDKILSKLFLNLIQTDRGVLVVLNFTQDEDSLICKNTEPSNASSILFTEEILLLLAQAYKETKNRTRARWLLPHIETFLRCNHSKNLANISRELSDIAAQLSVTIRNVKTSKKNKHIGLGLANQYIVESQHTASFMA